MKRHIKSLLTTVLFLPLALPLSARTWADAANGRTLEGTYVESNATHVKVKTGTRTLDIEIAWLSDADKEFIREQTAKPAATGNSLATTFPSTTDIRYASQMRKALSSGRAFFSHRTQPSGRH